MFSIRLLNNQITIAISTRVNITTIIIERFFFSMVHQERILPRAEVNLPEKRQTSFEADKSLTGTVQNAD
jgi:hypothetical protein